MSFDEQTKLILIGAIIALSSSLFTAIITAVLNYQVSVRLAKRAKSEKYANTFGKLLATIQHNPSNSQPLTTMDDDKKKIQELFKDDESKMDGMMGLFEGHIEALQKPDQKDS